MLVKKDGRREPFSRAKIRTGLIRACEKRPVSMEKIDEIVETIERQVHERCEKELPSRLVGDMLMEQLKGLDQIAYIRFASVYREFSDVHQFLDTLEGLDSKERKEKAKAESGSIAEAEVLAAQRKSSQGDYPQ